MRRAEWGLVILLISPVGIAEARQQQPEQQEDSLAAAARRARELKKEQAKSAKVWDNDSMPKNPSSLSIVGNAPPAEEHSANAPSSAPGSSTPSDAKNADTDAKNKSAILAELAATKEQLQTLQNDLDILQRKFTLDQQMYYGKPNYAADKAGVASLQDEQTQIDAKQQEMANAQKKVADLLEKLNPASGTAN
jgi:hypothetical protein